MNANILVGIVFIVACYGAVSSLSSGQDDEGRAVKMVEVMKMSNEALQRILLVAKSFGLLQECDVSLPQKANLVCRVKGLIEVRTMKGKWKLKVSPYGFALLDVPSPWRLVVRDLVNPFTRFYLEGYIQNVLSSGASLIVYDTLVPDKEISHKYSYGILSKFFEISAKFGGAYSRRPSKYEAFIDDKTEWISDKFFTQQRLAGVNPMSLRRVTSKGGKTSFKNGVARRTFF